MSIGLAGLGLGLIGSIISAGGAMEQAQAQSEAAAYQSQVAANNAKIARENASLDIQAGEAAATNEGLKTRGLVGTEKAAQGASGIDVNTGSAANVRAGTEQIGLLDALTIRSNAAKAAYGQQVAATSQTAQSQLYGFESAQAKEAGPISAAGSLLSGVGTVGLNFAKLQNVGAGTGGGGSIFSMPGFSPS